QALTARSGDRDVLTQNLVLKATRDEIVGYQARVRSDPSDHVSRTALAARYLQVGSVEAALAELREAIQLAPQFPDAQYNLGAALLARGAKTDAIAAYRRAIELNADYAEAHNNLGVVLESMGDRATAVTHYERAIHIQPHQAGAHYNLANVRLADGAVADAVAHYRQALEARRCTHSAGPARRGGCRVSAGARPQPQTGQCTRGLRVAAGHGARVDAAQHGRGTGVGAPSHAGRRRRSPRCARYAGRSLRVGRAIPSRD
ncbi:MAG: hypothetical protein DMF90_08105, partial [Acidobacteria bacterium]